MNAKFHTGKMWCPLRAASAYGDREWEAEIVASTHRLGIKDPGQSDARFYNEKWQENYRLFHRSLGTPTRKAARLTRARGGGELYDG